MCEDELSHMHSHLLM